MVALMNEGGFSGRRPPACFGQGGECLPYHEWVIAMIAVMGGR
jgi:hypothetical protein